MRFQLLAKTMKWGSIMGLLLAATSWNSGANYRLLLNLVVLVGAIMVVRQAILVRQYYWASGFVAVALLLNPMVPVFTPAGNLMLLLCLIAVSPLILTFAALVDATLRLHPQAIPEPDLPRDPLISTVEWATV